MKSLDEELDIEAIVPTTTPKPRRELTIDDSILRKVEVVLKHILKFDYEVDLFPKQTYVKIKPPENISSEEALAMLTKRLGQACPEVTVESRDSHFWIILSC